MSTETTFQVPSLNCGHCVASVTRALSALHPLVEVQADPASKTVRVQAPASVERARLIAALTEAGYPPA
ncbi:heavy-metal-associated domain-containing protein [Inhella gelatinilytica]|uniref:Heavy-metal-associated domain-containing protein n=1 Tax=Inhella gelatinilytica TaxID=2795030 RepID=A0A931NBT8_9BURK|nr:heavy-metal-associated domain-containing protein [Inhella gelatinilytica]MBH9551282.1 heavy-metal-associated domain-containing protein [Inhella gelatinilytica]